MSSSQSEGSSLVSLTPTFHSPCLICINCSVGGPISKHSMLFIKNHRALADRQEHKRNTLSASVKRREEIICLCQRKGGGGWSDKNV